MSEIIYAYNPDAPVWYVQDANRIIFGEVVEANAFVQLPGTSDACPPHASNGGVNPPEGSMIHLSNSGQNVQKTVQYTIRTFDLDGEVIGQLHGIPESDLFADIDDALAEYRIRLGAILPPSAPPWAP